MDKKKEKKEKTEDMTTQKTEKITGEIKKEEKKEEKVKANSDHNQPDSNRYTRSSRVSYSRQRRDRNFIGDQGIRKRNKC